MVRIETGRKEGSAASSKERSEASFRVELLRLSICVEQIATQASKLGATVQVLFLLVVDLAIETSVCFRVSTSSSKTVEYNCGFRSTL